MMPEQLDKDYITAIGLMVLTAKGSTSFIQRTLGLGYNAASRLVERMEDENILARPNHIGKREVLVTPAEVIRLRTEAAATVAANAALTVELANLIHDLERIKAHETELATECESLRKREAEARKLLDSWMDVANHCDISDGVCCCGDSMAGHANPMDCGHSPVDYGARAANGIAEITVAFLAGGQP